MDRVNQGLSMFQMVQEFRVSQAYIAVARLDGGELTLILKEARSGSMEPADALLTSLEGAFYVDSNQVYISGRIGLTGTCQPDSDSWLTS